MLSRESSVSSSSVLGDAAAKVAELAKDVVGHRAAGLRAQKVWQRSAVIRYPSVATGRRLLSKGVLAPGGYVRKRVFRESRIVFLMVVHR